MNKILLLFHTVFSIIWNEITTFITSQKILQKNSQSYFLKIICITMTVQVSISYKVSNLDTITFLLNSISN